MPPKYKRMKTSYARSSATKRQASKSPARSAVGQAAQETKYTFKKQRKYDLLDEQFEFPPIPDWRQGQKQKVLGKNYIIHKPVADITPHPVVVEFFLQDKDEVFALGPNSRFHVKMRFEKKVGDADWTGCVIADAKKIIVDPDCFEGLIKIIDVFNGNIKVNTTNEGQYIPKWLNTFKLATMENTQKKVFCPQPSHPGYGVPTQKGNKGWSNADGSEWLKYAASIFIGNKDVEFDYIPMDTPPFFQGSNYMEDMPKILPIPIMESMTIRFNFNDKWDNWYRRLDPANTDQYRLRITDFTFVGEHLRLNPEYQTKLLAKKTRLHYPGVTRIFKAEVIAANSLLHIAKLQSVAMPEGIFIFAVPNKVMNGTYTYGENTDGQVFLDHNIKDVKPKFGDKTIFYNEPNPGMTLDDTMELKRFFEYLYAPPFGMNMNPDLITLDYINANWKETPYPHVFINLCNFGDKSRVVPWQDDGSIINEDKDLELKIEFDDGGALANATYCIYLYYTDNNLIIDTTDKPRIYFTSPIVKKL